MKDFVLKTKWNPSTLSWHLHLVHTSSNLTKLEKLLVERLGSGDTACLTLEDIINCSGEKLSELEFVITGQIRH